MLQSLFNPKLWREGQKHPVGPSFSAAYERQKDLSNNLLCFKAPPPRGEISLVVKDDYPDFIDIYDQSKFKDLRTLSATEGYYRGEALRRQIFASSWQLYGRPLIDGYMGDLQLSVSVRQLPKLPIGESLFHPEVFAREIRKEEEFNYLNEFHNGYNDDEWDFTNTRWPHYLGPLNWQWQNIHERRWLYYELQSLRDFASLFCWYIPLTNTHFLQCYFAVTKSSRLGGNAYCQEMGVASDPYLKLMHQIMSTLTLTRTPELAAREQQVLADHPNSRLLLHPGPSAEQLAFAARVMWKWSASDMRIEKKEGVDYRAKPEDVADLIKRRIQPKPLSGYIDSAIFADEFPAGKMFAGGTKFERGN